MADDAAASADSFAGEPSSAGGAGGAGEASSAGYRPIFLHIRDESGEIVDLLEVERDPSEKPYYGGYRDSRTGVDYHHAATQCGPERVSKWANAPVRYTRESQTSTVVTRSIQSKREGGAQTKRSDLHFDTATDREVTPRPYFTSEQLMAVRQKAALHIQCQWRASMAREAAEALRREREEAAAAAYEDEMRKAAELEAKHQRDIERRMHPRTAEDFGVLYDEVEAWRSAETARIHSEVADAEAQKEALAALLAKETALLGTIERLRTVANKENREKRVSEFMSSLARSQTWQTRTGDVVVVDTPFITRARELKDIFDGLSDTKLSRDDRCELLLHVKYTVKEFDCALTRDIVGLVDRETDMLNRGRPESTLTALRHRLRNLFLMFAENPEFNPEAARFHKLPPRDARTTPSFLRPPPPGGMTASAR